MSDSLGELVDKFGALSRLRAAAMDKLHDGKGKNGAEFDRSASQLTN